MTTLPVQIDQIPAALRALPQWVNWRVIMREGKPNKVPYNTRTGLRASTTDPATWSSFEAACEAYEDADNAYSGIGFVFAAGGGVFGFDADHMRDAETGEIQPEARAWLDRLNTYAEVSQSETGIHAIGFGVLPGEGKNPKSLPYELYDRERFFTVTGQRLTDYPETPQPVNGALHELWEVLDASSSNIPDAPIVSSPPRAFTLSDDEVIDKASNATNGGAFRALWAGDTSTHGDNDSSADMALCNHLAWWTNNNPEQMDRLFRRSGLMRDKWDQRRGKITYGDKTIREALRITAGGYTPQLPPVLISRGRRVDTSTGEVLEDDEEAEDTPEPAEDRIRINLSNKWIRTNVAEALAALAAGNEPEPVVFVQGRSLIRVVATRNGLTPEPYTVHSLRTRLSACADLYRFDSRTKKHVKTDASDTLLQAMLAESCWDLPELDGIIEVPVLRLDGTILDTPGYDPASRLMYVPAPNLHVPAVADIPSSTDVARACSMIFDELLSDFAFAGLADKAHALALFLLPYLRDSIDGATPLHLIEAPTPGSGKGLLADVLLHPAVGHRIGVITDARDPDEQRKRITAQFRDGMPVILLDNIANTLDSDALASALTARVWSDRKLGSSDMVHYPVRCIWVATANNPTMSTEIARRCVRIRIDPRQDRPWDRKEFKHDDLRTWAAQHRGELIWCALTLLRAWICAGRKPATERLGSYEQWATAIGGVLAAAGVPGFLTNLSEIYELSDPQGTAWRQFIGLWWDKYEDAKVGVRDLFTLAETVDALSFGRATTERAQRTSFGMQLARQRDRIIDDFLIQHCGTEKKIAVWQLRPTAKQAVEIVSPHEMESF
ncbi:MAG: putative P-loop ATPase-like protein [Chloroflexi bacterium]|nr:putative P-loop ATPase-like protein [Chloroflexota bacterium]